MSFSRTLSLIVASTVAASAATLASAGGGQYVYRTTDQSGKIVDLAPRGTAHSVARQWNEVLLEGIRHDKARPTVHARNLYHTSAAMWDAWAAYDDHADQVFHHERQTAADVQAARDEAVSYAAYRILKHRFTPSVGAGYTIPLIEAQMSSLGYDPNVTTLIGDTPAALGNRIANTIILFGLSDGANELNDYDNLWYTPVNDPLYPAFPGNPDIVDPNRWQPLAIDFFVDQSGNIIPLGSLTFLSPEWGIVPGFAINDADITVHPREGFPYPVCHDPGPPPMIGGDRDPYYRWGNEMVAVWSSQLDPMDGVLIDISPDSFGNSPLPDVDDWANYYNFFNGGDAGMGWDLNPVTGQPYPQQVVHRGDYARILAEFWADGPNSETPPGHWFTILNYVNDHPLFEKRFHGEGPIIDDLEWDVKAYLLMAGTMHDCAIAAWGCKGAYDFVRPISALRYMGDRGQSSDPGGPSYDPNGVTLYPGYVEVVTAESTAPGERHEHLAGNEGKIAVKAWRGPDYILDPDTDVAGVGWILLENWWPYQRPSFVTPPFAGYVSGHSTYSRAASELMTDLTGDAFFPGGVGEFFCPQNEFLVFEDGPTEDITLQWATYRDASDQCSLSRIWGGIHPPCDDLPGRQMGFAVEEDSFRKGVQYFHGNADCLADVNGDTLLDLADIVAFVQAFQAQDPVADLADPVETYDLADLVAFIQAFMAGCP
ncbi:MAG: vanadium-dependent haloperoxidase [Phycisphaeraceae bacterium]|nr:MAG: vanadium-dependent haloperoxidase [Phycisphaeraceae bacterium]